MSGGGFPGPGENMKFERWFPFLALALAACPAAPEPPPAIADDDDSSAVADEDPCAYPLVKLRTGQSETCEGGNEHHWPVGMATDDCHGWAATDPRGSLHENSASGIRCNSDGSFEFTQFAGNLLCEGTGVSKVFHPGECVQDTPPVLHTVAFDLTCCSEPESPECLAGVPSVSIEGATVTLNGEDCSS